MLDAAEIERLRGWVGREETAEDALTPALADRFRATLGERLYGDGLMGIHWCLAPRSVATEELAEDGHGVRDGFLPPVPYASRMWAGGGIRFHAPLEPGQAVERRSRVASLTPKEGRSGPLVFVTVEHGYHAGGTLCVEERHDIVFRPAAKLAGAEVVDGPAPRGAFVGDPVMLFRYSALTFNGHRIHYDHPYATGEEGYAGLVVHGPLQATLLMNAAARAAGTPALSFEYRGLAPLIAGEPVTVRAEDGRAWLEKGDGTVTFDSRFAPLEGGA